MFHLRDQPLSSCQRWKRGNEWQHDQCSSENNDVEADTTYLSGDQLCKQPRIRSKHWHQWEIASWQSPDWVAQVGHTPQFMGLQCWILGLGHKHHTTTSATQNLIFDITVFATMKSMTKSKLNYKGLTTSDHLCSILNTPRSKHQTNGQTNTEPNALHTALQQPAFCLYFPAPHNTPALPTRTSDQILSADDWS